MGEVKDRINPSSDKPAPKRKAGTESAESIVEQVKALKDELSTLTAKKDEDALSEGASAKPENTRKAATLRACHSLLTATLELLEDY